MITVKKAGPDDSYYCITTLTEAFNNDPVINWFIRQDRRRDMALRLFFRIAYNSLTLPHGHVYTSDERCGVALWTPPGKWKLGSIEQASLIPAYAKAFGLKRLNQVLPPISRMQKHHPRFPHYYLFALGVKPELQRRGIGSIFMKEVLAKCDRENIPAYLEATSPANRDLYMRHGFKVTKKFNLPNNGPGMWFMLREPGKH